MVVWLISILSSVKTHENTLGIGKKAPKGPSDSEKRDSLGWWTSVLRPCPHELCYFQNHSFFYTVWPLVHTQTLYQVTETEHFWKLLPGWRFSKTPVAVLLCRQRNRRFWLVTSEHALLTPPTGNFFSLLIGQHGFTVEIKSPPVFMWMEFFLKNRRKNSAYKNTHVRVDMA